MQTSTRGVEARRRECPGSALQLRPFSGGVKISVRCFCARDPLQVLSALSGKRPL
jgi:hypothetical protein